MTDTLLSQWKQMQNALGRVLRKHLQLFEQLFFRIPGEARFWPESYVELVLWVTGVLPLWYACTVALGIAVVCPLFAAYLAIAYLDEWRTVMRIPLQILVICLASPWILLVALCMAPVVLCVLPLVLLAHTHLGSLILEILLYMFAVSLTVSFLIAALPLTLCYKMILSVYDAIFHPNLVVWRQHEPWWARLAFHVSQTFLLNTCHQVKRARGLLDYAWHHSPVAMPWLDDGLWSQAQHTVNTIVKLIRIHRDVAQSYTLIQYKSDQARLSFLSRRHSEIQYGCHKSFHYVEGLLWITGVLPLCYLSAVLWDIVIACPWAVGMYLFDKLQDAHPVLKYPLQGLLVCLSLPWWVVGISCEALRRFSGTRLGRGIVELLLQGTVVLLAVAMCPLTLCYKAALGIYDAIRNPNMQLFQPDRPWYSRAAFHVSQTFLLDTYHQKKRNRQLLPLAR